MNKTLLIAIGWLLCAAMAPLAAQEPKGVADRLLEDLNPDNAPTENESSPGWHRVAEEMMRISRQLPEPKASGDTLAAQETLIKQLTQLLERSRTGSTAAAASSEKPPGNASKNESTKQSPNRPSDDQNQGATGEGPATKAGAAGDQPAERAATIGKSQENLMRRAWGNLPGRVRDRLQSSTPEQFHRKYQTESEAYFRKLSEKELRP